jgi:surfactin synthase thioesterase subunit
MSAVVHHVAALLDGRLDLPFAFYGHSMGAVTALEVARRLVAAGLPPSCLVVSGAAAPHLPSKREHALHQLPEAELIRELIRLEGLPAIAHQRDDYFETFLPTIRADIECRERWIAEVSDLAIPIYALGGVSDRMVTRSDLSDWKEYTSGPFELRQFAGGHFFINTTTREVVTYIAAAVAARCLSR